MFLQTELKIKIIISKAYHYSYRNRAISLPFPRWKLQIKGLWSNRQNLSPQDKDLNKKEQIQIQDQPEAKRSAQL